jgi:1-phosphofructokinase
MITTVTLNPAIDKIIEIRGLTVGQVHRAQRQVVTLGGKSINVARIISSLSEATKAICFAGRDNFEGIKNHAEADGIPIDAILVSGSTRTNVKIVEPDQNYRTTDINEIGFKVTDGEREAMTTKILEAGKNSEYVVLSGSLPEGIPNGYYREIGEKLKGITKVIIDADDRILLESLKGSPFLIKPNIHELEAALDMKLEGKESIVHACKKVIDDYGVNYVLVSMGEEGSILVSERYALSAGILPLKVVSTVGAGDAMLAGFIYGLKTHQDCDELDCLIKALSYGVASSSIAISTQSHMPIEALTLTVRAKEVAISRL